MTLLKIVAITLISIGAVAAAVGYAQSQDKQGLGEPNPTQHKPATGGKTAPTVPERKAEPASSGIQQQPSSKTAGANSQTAGPVSQSRTLIWVGIGAVVIGLLLAAGMVLWRLYGEDSVEASAFIDEELAKGEVEVEVEDDNEELSQWQRMTGVQKIVFSMSIGFFLLIVIVGLVYILSPDSFTTAYKWVTGIGTNRPYAGMHQDIKTYFEFCESKAKGSEKTNWERFKEIVEKQPEKNISFYRCVLSPDLKVASSSTNLIGVASRILTLYAPSTITVKITRNDCQSDKKPFLGQIRLTTKEYYDYLTDQGKETVAAKCKEHQQYMERVIKGETTHTWGEEPDMWFEEDILKDEVKNKLKAQPKLE